jgi:hypothetical protein
VAHAIVTRVAYRLPPSILAAVVAAVMGACGNGTVATRTPVENFNRVAEARDVKLVCPEEVDKGKQFDCTLQGTKTGKTATVRMEGLDDKDAVVNAADGPAFISAVQQVTQP